MKKLLVSKWQNQNLHRRQSDPGVEAQPQHSRPVDQPRALPAPLPLRPQTFAPAALLTLAHWV